MNTDIPHSRPKTDKTGDYIDYIRATQEKKKELTKMTRNLCREFEKDIAKNIKIDPKAFWRYTNSKLKSGPALGDLVDGD